MIRRRCSEPRQRRPGFFKLEGPGQLWHLDMTSVWVVEHGGWVYLKAIIDCCTREIVGWELSLRCRASEAIAVIERAVLKLGILPGTLTLGTDNGFAFSARATRPVTQGSAPRIAAVATVTPIARHSSNRGSLPQGTLRLATRVRDPRTGPGGDRRLHRPLPPPAVQPAQLLHAGRSPTNLGRRARPSTKTAA
jgi:transposase InsO family protein